MPFAGMFLLTSLRIGMLDYRLTENRREAFIRWYAWSLEHNDCDPAVWITNYINKRYEHNDEQRLWFCWLYGNTYHLPTAWVLMNEFPDFELATVDRMEQWNTANYQRLRYQTDTKWNKGHLPTMFASYKEFIGNRSQREALESYCKGSPEENFDALWDAVKGSLHKFGRYSTWFYLQHLKHTANIRIQPTSLMLDDYSGSRSHRNGLLFAIGKDEDYDRKLSTAEYGFLESISTGIIREMVNRFSHLESQIDYFTMETCLCSFKKIFREREGRYLGYYLDRQSEEIKKVSADGWYGIEWDVLWQARAETLDHRLATRDNIAKEKFPYFVKTGKIDRMEWMFEDEEPMKIGLEMFT